MLQPAAEGALCGEAVSLSHGEGGRLPPSAPPRPPVRGSVQTGRGRRGRKRHPSCLKVAQQPLHSQETPHILKTRSPFWQQSADPSPSVSRAPGSTWVGPKAPTEVTSVAPSRMMWQNAKKKKSGGRKRLAKVMSLKK